MQDKSVARQVAPDGSRLGIMPTTSGGVATLPRAPGHERPSATLSGVPGHDRPRATPQAPDQDVPRALPARAPGSDRPCAAPSVPVTDRSRPVQKAPGHGRPPAAPSGVPGHDRPRATPRAPGADVPLATTAGVPGQRCPSAAHWARDHFRSRPAPTAPVQDVPWALAVRVPGSDRPCALAATAAAPDGPHVLHLAPSPDSSHRGPDAGSRPTSLTAPTTPAHDLYGRAYTAQEVQQLTQADRTPLFDAKVRLLQALTQRPAAPGHPLTRCQHHRRQCPRRAAAPAGGPAGACTGFEERSVSVT